MAQHPNADRTSPPRSTWWCVLRALKNVLAGQFGFNARWLASIPALWRYRREYRTFARLNRDGEFSLRVRDIAPCLTDRTVDTPIEPTYFLQDAWFAGRIAARRPACHVDVGSSVRTLSIVAQFIPVTLVDIRSIPLAVDGFTYQPGTILALPHADRSVGSLSSLCVIEHIGLGRYGDPLDARGSERAAAELVRVLAPGGDLYVSVPVDETSRIHFNAHRAFTRDHLLSLFPGLELVAERYIYGSAYAPAYAADRGFGTGLYHFRCPAV